MKALDEARTSKAIRSSLNATVSLHIEDKEFVDHLNVSQCRQSCAFCLFSCTYVYELCIPYGGLTVEAVRQPRGASIRCLCCVWCGYAESAV